MADAPWDKNADRRFRRMLRANAPLKLRALAISEEATRLWDEWNHTSYEERKLPEMKAKYDRVDELDMQADELERKIIKRRNKFFRSVGYREDYIDDFWH